MDKGGLAYLLFLVAVKGRTLAKAVAMMAIVS